MIFKISWNNIWRNKLRTGVVIGAMILGIWALVFLFAFTDSITQNMVSNAIKYDYSHIQLHHKNYRNDQNLVNSIPVEASLSKLLNEQEGIAAYSERIIISGMLASAKTTIGCSVYGIMPDEETDVTFLENQLTEGTYFSEIRRNPLLLSEKLAEKLKIKLRSKVVLTFQDSHGNITAASFRVEGLIKAKSARINEGVVFVRKNDLEILVNLKDVQEIGIRIKNIDNVDEIKDQLQAALEQLEVASYKDLAPDLNVMIEQTKVSKAILLVIIMLALVFGIINTMLMAVLERTKEIGMLMAIGMQKLRIFKMIVLETIMISIAGAPLGLLLGYLTLSYFQKRGFDFSNYAESLESYGIDAIIYPSLEASNYAILALVVVLTAILASIYPARKATKLKPVEALRKL